MNHDSKFLAFGKKANIIQLRSHCSLIAEIGSNDPAYMQRVVAECIAIGLGPPIASVPYIQEERFENIER
jgi:hypothetical protein